MRGISQRTATSLLANAFYSAERGDDVYELNDVSWIGNIALLYVSEVGAPICSPLLQL